MRCEDARRYLGPYIDSELDATVSFDIAKHIESCEACRTRFDAERAIESRVSESLRETQPGDDELVARALKRARRPRRWPWAAAAFAIAVAAVLVLLLRPHHDLVDELLHDYEGLASGKTSVELRSSDSAEIERFFQDQLGMAVHLKPQSVMQPEGARRCSLRGTPTAFLAYRCRDHVVSVAIFDAAHLDRFPAAKAVLERSPLEEIRGAHRVVAERRGWKVVCVTGDLPADELWTICRSVSE